MGSIPTPPTKQGNIVEQNKKEEFLEALSALSDVYVTAMKEIEAEQEEFWNSLSKEDQIKCFCAISRRIYKGEIEDKGSYRYVLYTVFGFGPEAYAQAQDAGYLSIHNAIYDAEHERDTLAAFAKHLGSTDPDEAVSKFYQQQL